MTYPIIHILCGIVAALLIAWAERDKARVDGNTVVLSLLFGPIGLVLGVLLVVGNNFSVPNPFWKREGLGLWLLIGAIILIPTAWLLYVVLTGGMP
jgi:hypothetical protein